MFSVKPERGRAGPGRAPRSGVYTLIVIMMKVTSDIVALELQRVLKTILRV